MRYHIQVNKLLGVYILMSEILKSIILGIVQGVQDGYPSVVPVRHDLSRQILSLKSKQSI